MQEQDCFEVGANSSIQIKSSGCFKKHYLYTTKHARKTYRLKEETMSIGVSVLTLSCQAFSSSTASW
jgi:hypothetical protein